ncbi:uncharacterized protein LOC132067311 [Lycium ferocissimum]|uniref:uncharacterized protein LOC132067311 n=1 Tax=Lycium ferocissimum TaxID=112874 RepID=UPI002814D3BD|nr:uncharacterized protein LOC132067311 [Lycium ferocissimum]
MELSMSSTGNEVMPVYDPCKGKDKQEPKKWSKFVPKSNNKESMNVNASPVKFTTKVSKKQSMKATSFQDNKSRKSTLKEMQEREYPFLDSDVPEIFDELLELKLIELPEMKRPNEAGRTNDPNYCKYHRLVGHPFEKCFVFKDKVMQLANENKITQLMMRRRRRCKTSPRKESSTQPTRKRMVRRLRKQKSVERPKKEKVEENYHQEPRRPVTLGEFLPSWFRNKTARDNIEASCFNADKEEANDESLSTLSLSSSEELAESSSKEVHTCDTRITFTDDDLLLGETLHNRPLYMVGYALEKRINRILIDDGSGVNILPIRTMKELGITTEELSESRLMIQGFNQGGQRAIGAVKVDITIEDLRSSAWMHVIDAKTSYNMLLGRPWIHENKVVPSSYYQCLKYLEGGVEKKIVALMISHSLKKSSHTSSMRSST